MNVTKQHIDNLLGSQTYREEAVRAAIEGGVARLQTVKLEHNPEAELLLVEAPTFETVLDLSNSQTSPEVLRERLDELLAEEMENHMKQTFR